MAMTRRNLKIAKVINQFQDQTRILDLADLMDIKEENGELVDGKIVCSLTEKIGDTSKHLQAYVDVSKFRAFAHKVLSNKDTSKQTVLDVFGGGPGEKAKHPEHDWVSRRLKIEQTLNKKSDPVYIFSFTISPGKKSSTGAFMPDGEPIETASIVIDATRMLEISAAVLEYMLAKKTAYLLKGEQNV